MAAKKEPPRRTFMKQVGTGIVGSAVLSEALSAQGTGGEEGEGRPHEGNERLGLTVNGRRHTLMVKPSTTLVELLRDHLGLSGTKVVCNQGECGACTVLLDGAAVCSCHLLALDAAGREVTTIEGLLDGEELHPIQQAFVDHDGMQCGFCTPGQVMAAQGLLNLHPRPTAEQIREGMAGTVCRCAAYPNIMASVLKAAEQTRGAR
jgi:xanthine dehydrogenase YagT iron-sulfur-binding subunit